SIDFAAQVGAGVLVCHLGSVRYLWLQPDRHMEAYLATHPDAVRSGDPGFLASLPPPLPTGYWHDTGHGHLKESAGLINHRAQLEANAPRQLGFHLHDVDAGGADHQAVGSGMV